MSNVVDRVDSGLEMEYKTSPSSFGLKMEFKNWEKEETLMVHTYLIFSPDRRLSLSILKLISCYFLLTK